MDNDETEDASSSTVDPQKLGVVEVLFFLGRGGSGLPGSSVCNCL